MLKSSQIDLATLPEPLASVALLYGANLIANSEELNINTAYIIFNKETIDQKNEEIKAFYKGYNKAVEYINTHDKSEFIDALMENAGFPPVVKDTIVLPHYTKAQLPKEEDAAEVFKWLDSKNLIDAQYNLSEISTDVFID
jgi:NitT/TauT family transport system substrate-binding protein